MGPQDSPIVERTLNVAVDRPGASLAKRPPCPGEVLRLHGGQERNGSLRRRETLPVETLPAQANGQRLVYQQ
jgi:hypothetical protein